MKKFNEEKDFVRLPNLTSTFMYRMDLPTEMNFVHRTQIYFYEQNL